jgi:hypothetical protein
VFRNGQLGNPLNILIREGGSSAVFAACMPTSATIAPIQAQLLNWIVLRHICTERLGFLFFLLSALLS